jgi:hypothetical protein
MDGWMDGWMDVYSAHEEFHTGWHVHRDIKKHSKSEKGLKERVKFAKFTSMFM